MFASAALAMLMPGADVSPLWLPPVLLAVMMGFSCARITMAEIRAIRLRDVAGFYALRFVFMPLAFFALCHMFLPDYQYAVLLLLLLPTAVSAAAMASLFGANAALAMSGTILSSALAPLVIPLAFHYAGMEVALDITGIFKALIGIVFMPALAYFLVLRRFEPTRGFMKRNAGLVSVVLFSAFIFMVIAEMRTEILESLPLFLGAFVPMGALFFMMYALGWCVFWRSAYPERAAFALLSGGNNMGLGVSIGLLYFPAREMLLLIVCEFMWIAALSLFQMFLRRQGRAV